jgi:hypothetical protein
VIQLLIEKKVIVVQRQATNLLPVCYRFPSAFRGDILSLPDSSRGDTQGALGVTSEAFGGDTGVTQTINKPSDKPSFSSLMKSDMKLCSLLADLIESNGSKRPTITNRWLNDMRLLSEKDGRTYQQIENMIRWCQADEFWRANIMSPAKLRSKYDQMRLKAIAVTRNKSRDQVKERAAEATKFTLGLFNVSRETITRPVDNELVEKVLQTMSLQQLGRMTPEEIHAIFLAAAYE